MEWINKIIDYIKNNLLISIIAFFAVVILFFPKIFRFASTRRRKRRIYRPITPNRVRRAKRSYNKNGKAKKAWQIKGSEAARRHMARIRRMK
jgi:hypothetical protein